MSSPSVHPCQRCGACCAAFRVAFHWSEADDAEGGTVPLAMTFNLRQHERAMRGTEGVGAIRCVALQGTLGEATQCAIYPLRPSPCRTVQASWEHGSADAQCDRARARHGLPALTPDDWR